MMLSAPPACVRSGGEGFVEGGLVALCWRGRGDGELARLDVEFGREDVKGVGIGLGLQFAQLVPRPFDAAQGILVSSVDVGPLGDDVLHGDQVGAIGVGALPQLSDTWGGVAHGGSIADKDLCTQGFLVGEGLVVLGAQGGDVGDGGPDRAGQGAHGEEVFEGEVVVVAVTGVVVEGVGGRVSM